VSTSFAGGDVRVGADVTVDVGLPDPVVVADPQAASRKTSQHPARMCRSKAFLRNRIFISMFLAMDFSSSTVYVPRVVLKQVEAR